MSNQQVDWADVLIVKNVVSVFSAQNGDYVKDYLVIKKLNQRKEGIPLLLIRRSNSSNG